MIFPSKIDEIIGKNFCGFWNQKAKSSGAKLSEYADYNTQRRITMKKVIICVLFLLLLFTMPVFAEQAMFTSGVGYFAVSERLLNQAVCLDKHGHYKPLSALLNIGMVVAPFQGQTVKVISCHHGIYRVHFSDSKIIWWATGKALTNKGGKIRL